MGNSNSSSVIRTLPVPSGPYSVGLADIMHGYSLDGVFLRLFYPIDKCDLMEHRSQLGPWLPKAQYVDGYVNFIKLPVSLFRFIFKWYVGDILIPALYHAPVHRGRFPIIVFSHGMLANRTTYSTICCDMASHGFVVAAVEHRDGSASYSYCLKERAVGGEEPVPYRTIPLGEKEFHVRKGQMDFRTEECRRALALLRDMDDGRAIDNLMADPFDFHDFKGRLDFDRVAIMGHSFGGATVIAAVATDQVYKVGIVLDGWMYPLHKDIYPSVKAPLLFVNMEAFQWSDNILRMKRLQSPAVDRPMFTIRGSVHYNQTDMAFLVKGWIGYKMHAHGPTDPQLCNDINNELCLAFLRKHMDWPGVANTDQVVKHYENWIIVGTNVELDEARSSL